MPSFSLLRKSPREPKKQKQKQKQITESILTQETQNGRATDWESSPGKNGNLKTNLDDGERKGRRGSARDLLQDLVRSKFGKAPSTPQRGTSAPPTPTSRRGAAVVSDLSSILNSCHHRCFATPTIPSPFQLSIRLPLPLSTIFPSCKTRECR